MGEEIVVYSPTEITDLDAAVTVIETIIMSKGASLNPGVRQGLRKEGAKSVGYVDAVHAGLEATPESVPENFGMAAFDRDILAKAVTKSIFNRISVISERCGDIIMVMGHQNIRHADGGLKILKLAADGNAAVGAILKAIMDPKKHEKIHVTVISIPASGSVFTDGGLRGKHVTNFGDKVIKATKDKLTTGETLIGPGDNFEIPSTWDAMTLANMSSTGPAAYTLT